MNDGFISVLNRLLSADDDFAHEMVDCFGLQLALVTLNWPVRRWA
jgi:hypothetical protein